MNKYVIIIGIVIVILVAGVGYRTFLLPEELAPEVTGVERELTVIAKKDNWRFEPEFVEVDKGDKIILTMINEDDYDHGIAIDAFGIAQRMPARATVKTDFIVTQEGDFPFYCSVPCGEGIVDGAKRTHFDMIGIIHAKSIVSETSDYKPTVSDEELREGARRRSFEVAADEKVKELGYDPAALEFVFDEGNTAWNATGRSLPELDGVDYQAVYYLLEPTEVAGRLWIFINSSTGDVVATTLDE